MAKLGNNQGVVFLGVGNFYRKFINEFSTLAKPFMNLL
jgi:hypothetical protein